MRLPLLAAAIADGNDAAISDYIDSDLSKEYTIRYERRSKFDIALEKLDLDAVMAKVESKVVEELESKLMQRAAKEIETYVSSQEFKSLVDFLRRKERERIIHEVDEEMKVEKGKLLAYKQMELKQSFQEEPEKVVSAESIMLQNKIALENHQRMEFEKKLKQDALRLQEVQLEAEKKRKQQQQEQEEEERRLADQRKNTSSSDANNSSINRTKVSIGLAKKRF